MSVQREPIAIVGMSAIHPGSSDSQGFWMDIVNGRDLIEDVPSHYWLIEDYFDPNPAAEDKTYARRGAFLSRIPFDAREFGVPPAALPATDSAQLLALIGAQRVLRDAAAGRPEHVSRERISVILGVAGATASALSTAGRLQRPLWVKGLRESGLPEDEVQAACARIAANFTPLQENTFPGLLSNVVAGRIANRFDLGGSNFVVDAACAGSLAAVSVAMNELHLGQADMVITGGVDAMNDVLMYMCFSKTPALSPTGDCRPFSDRADGTMIGEGLSMFALRRLSDAERDGDQIYAVISGLGSSSDGRAKSVYAPRPKGQALALRRAYEAAGFGPETVELVEAHGTGTPAGDVAEFEALRNVYEEAGRKDPQWCALGSVKSQIGHTKSAAGAAALFKTAMALHQKVLPPTIKAERLNPKLDVPSSPFYINTEARPWIGNDRHPRRAAVSSFGFGGTNFHVALEEYTGPSRRIGSLMTSREELFLASAASPGQLVQKCLELAKKLAEGLDLRRAARESQQHFDSHAGSRIAFLAANAEHLQEKLNSAAIRLQNTTGNWSDPSGVFYRSGGSPGKIAFLFAGQGSQYPDMGKDLAIHFDEARQAWELADAALAPDAARFHEVVFPLPAFNDEERQAQAKRLTATENAQPALAGAALAHLAVLATLGVKPDFAAGHSFGEFAALHCAGVISAEDLLRLARKRGTLMSSASAVPGAMTAVSQPVTALEALLGDFVAGGPADVVIANYNSPDQTVLAGTLAAITNFENKLTASNIVFRRLPVSAAFHSHLLSSASEPFARFVEQVPVAIPRLPVVSNMDAAWYPSNTAEIRRMLAEHLVSPVRYSRQIDELYEKGVRTFVELGSGAVLTGLVTSCLQGRDYLAVSLDRKGRNGITSLLHALGQLAVCGVDVNFAGLWSAFAPVPEPKPVNSPSTFLIDGSNYAKPYPPPGGAAGLPKPNPKAAPTGITPSAPVAPPPPLPIPMEPPVFTSYQQPQPASSTSLMTEIQKQIADAQKASHDAILESLSLTLKSFEALAGRTFMPAPTMPSVAETAQAFVMEPAAPRMEVRPEPVAPVAYEPAAPIAPAVPVAQFAPQFTSPKDVAGELLRIVSEKTGYPVEVLDLDADLESGLGIDSIKRVEIFSALEEQVPGLPDLKPENIAALRTLGQIVAFIGGTSSSAPLPGSAQSTPSQPAPTPYPAPTSGMVAADLRGELLRIVSEKTGYPVEVLDLDADLESGLGIDSIKRVEIFSALAEQVPSLPELKPDVMASLRTLGQIASFLGGTETAASATIATIAGPLPAVAQYVHTHPCPAPGLPMPGIFSAARVAITPGSPGLAGELAARLTILGIAAEAVDEVTSDFDGVIFLGALRPFETLEQAIAVNYDAFHAAQTLSSSAGENKLFVTVQGTGGDFGLSGADPIAAWSAGIAALAKTAAEEWPGGSVKAIDLETGDRDASALAEAIVGELLNGGPQLEVGLKADGSRVTLAAVEQTAAPNRTLPAGPVIVVAGGGRGVTAACTVQFAKSHKDARIALLGRTRISAEPACCQGANDETAIRKALANQAKADGNSVNLIAIQAEASHILAVREIQGSIAALEQAGAKAMYLSVDLRDVAAVTAALHQVRSQWGPITGVVHGSGVLADKRIAEKTDAQFERVFDTKVGGLRALLAATESDPLDSIFLFSSVSARYGNAGQCDYAMANEILNKVAGAEKRRRGSACVVRSLNWGPWAGGMVNASLAAHFESRGVALLPLPAGSQAFVEQMLSSGETAVEVVLTVKGAPALAGAARAASHFEVLVNSRTYPFLNGHRIQKTAVVPAALVLEWFHRAAAAIYPEAHVNRCDDLRVLSGIVLTDFDGHGSQLKIRCEPFDANPGKLRCQLLSMNGKVHYSATLSTAIGIGSTKQPAPLDPVHVNGHSNGLDFYPAKLFHGPEFQVIRHLHEMAEHGASAILTGTEAMKWPSQARWQTDVASLDGALQVIRLWTSEQLGGPSLPTRIGQFTSFINGEQPPGLINCVARCRTVGKLRTVADVILADLDGRPLAELREVEMHVTAEAE